MVENLGGTWRREHGGAMRSLSLSGRKIHLRSAARIITTGQVLRPVTMETAVHQTNTGAGAR